MKNQPGTGSSSVMATYCVKHGAEARARDIIARHWPVLRGHGLVTDEPATVFQARSEHGPVFLEIVTFKDADAADRARHLPEVDALWREMKEITEARGGRPAVDRPVVSRMDYVDDVPDEPAERAFTGLALYLVRPDAVGDFHDLMRRDWPILRDEGLVTGDRGRVWYGADRSGPFFLEVVRWYDQRGPGVAYRNDAVSRVWQEVFRTTEGRGARQANEYLWARELEFAHHRER
ncbi:hypothetical protein [Streptomyces sp. NPDC003717]|uniref:hypothetical protein n=1 Tax=Streptomyces sp. NPDC003717 TaxID=3154276 RepID=UPI00339F91D1